MNMNKKVQDKLFDEVLESIGVYVEQGKAYIGKPKKAKKKKKKVTTTHNIKSSCVSLYS